MPRSKTVARDDAEVANTCARLHCSLEIATTKARREDIATTTARREQTGGRDGADDAAAGARDAATAGARDNTAAGARDAAAAPKCAGKQARSISRTVKDAATFASFTLIALLLCIVVFPLRFICGKKYLKNSLSIMNNWSARLDSSAGFLS